MEQFANVVTEIVVLFVVSFPLALLLWVSFKLTREQVGYWGLVLYEIIYQAGAIGVSWVESRFVIPGFPLRLLLDILFHVFAVFLLKVMFKRRWLKTVSVWAVMELVSWAVKRLLFG